MMSVFILREFYISEGKNKRRACDCLALSVAVAYGKLDFMKQN